MLREDQHIINLEHKQERLRKYYETIAFGQSRTGLMVRSAMGTSSAAEKIINELKQMYNVTAEDNYL